LILCFSQAVAQDSDVNIGHHLPTEINEVTDDTLTQLIQFK